MGSRQVERDRGEHRRRTVGRVELQPMPAGTAGLARLQQLTGSPKSPTTADGESDDATSSEDEETPAVRVPVWGESTQMWIGLHRGTTPVARLIRWQTRSVYSHASLLDRSAGSTTAHEALLAGPGTWPLIEAREFRGVVCERSLAECAEDVDVFAVGLAQGLRAEVVAWALSQRGAPYDYTMILRFLSRQRETMNSQRRWFCSEFVAAALWAVNVGLLRDTPAWRYPPDWIARSPLVRPVGRWRPREGGWQECGWLGGLSGLADGQLPR